MRHYLIRPAHIVVIIAASLGVSSTAFAQGGTTAGRFVTGPMVWTPTFQLREAGVDSNVFNTPLNPKQDVSGNASARVNSILTLGLLQASTLGGVEYTYFERYKNQRGLNRNVSTHLEFPVSRFSPDVTVTWNHVKERPNNEIDTRAPRNDLAYTAGIQTKVTSRIDVMATAGMLKTSYETGFTFRDVEIARQLNRKTVSATATMRMALTPLTSLAIDGTASHDEFPFKPESATDNGRIGAHLEFAPDAIIRGSATVGYHQMRPYHRQVANTAAGAFAGLASSVDLAYTLLSVTRLSGRFARDSSYSINTNQPFYVSTGGGLEILQMLFGPVDLDVRGSREKLNYPLTEAVPAYVDLADTLAGGLSIRAAPQTVVALIYDNTRRRSGRGQEFGYQRRRIYTTVTYGF